MFAKFSILRATSLATLLLASCAGYSAPVSTATRPSTPRPPVKPVVLKHPNATPQPEMVLQLGHNGEIDATAASRDGHLLVSAGRDGMLKVWRTVTGELQSSVRASSGWVYAVALSPDSRTAVAGDDRGVASFWDTATGQKIFNLAIGNSPSPLLSLGYSPDGARVVAGTAGGTVTIVNTATHRIVRTRQYPGLRVDNASYSPDGRFIAIGLGRGIDTNGRSEAPGGERIEVRSSVDDSPVHTFPLPPGSRGACAFSPDSRFLVACPPDGSIVTFDVTTGKLAGKWTCNDYTPLDAQFSPTGASILTTGYGGELRLWDALSGALNRTITGLTPYGGSLSARWLGRTGMIAAGTHSGDILEWSAATGDLERAIDGYPGPRIVSLAISADGAQLGMLASPNTDNNGQAQLLTFGAQSAQYGSPDSQPGSPLAEETYLMPSPGNMLVYAPAGNLLLIAQSHQIVTLDQAGVSTVAVASSKDGTLFPRAAFLSDNSAIATASTTGGIALHNPATGTVIRSLDTGGDSICGFVFSADRTRVATLSQRPDGDGSLIQLRIWNAASGKLISTPAVYKSAAPVVSDGRVAMAVSPDGKLLVVGSEIRSLATGKLLARLPDAASAAAFSRDSHTLVDDIGTIWDPWTRSVRAGLDLPSDTRLLSLVITRDGTRILGGFDDGTVRQWDAATGKLLLTVHILRSIGGQHSVPEWIAIAPNGNYECSPNGEQTIRYRLGATLLPPGALHDRYATTGLMSTLLSSSR